jgi:hypothetical protein
MSGLLNPSAGQLYQLDFLNFALVWKRNLRGRLTLLPKVSGWERHNIADEVAQGSTGAEIM